MRVTKARADKCVTHFAGCDCITYKYQQMEQALKIIQIWAEHFEDGPAESALHDIEEKCKEVLK
jgi:hypothetical protein